MLAVTLAAELLLMNGIGIFIRRSGAVKKEFASQLTNMLMSFVLPCMIFRSVSTAVDFSLEALQQCAVVAVSAAVVVLLSLGIGQLFYKLAHSSGSGRILRYSLAFCHFSFMGIPVIEALFGDVGTFYYAFFLLPVRIAYYGLSQKLMTPAGQSDRKSGVWKQVRSAVLNPCLIAVVLGLIFWIADWRLPTVLDYCVKSMGTICSPLALLLCGLVIADYDFKSILRLKYLWTPLLRTVVMPAIFFALFRPFLSMGLEKSIFQIIVIYCALPTSSLLPVYAIQYDSDPENQLSAAAASVLSVLISAVTIPIWFLIIR